MTKVDLIKFIGGLTRYFFVILYYEHKFRKTNHNEKNEWQENQSISYLRGCTELLLGILMDRYL
jgi:hypothetical protein